MTRDTEGGFVAIELVLGLSLLVLPVALLVLTLPGWSERQVTARVISREIARQTAREGICDFGRARSVALTMSRNLGVPDPDISVGLSCRDGAALVPGSDVEARVTVMMPAVELPAIGAVDAWSWTARHREPVDVYAAAA